MASKGYGATASGVRYPLALDESGALVDVETFQKGSVARCPGCEREMTARKGRVRRWHFAHALDPSMPPCAQESALHRIAKMLIRDSFQAAKQAGRPYNLSWPCVRCGESSVLDCCAKWQSSACEVQIVSGVRADVVLKGPRPLAIEVVVAHDLEKKTESAYQLAEVAVVRVVPTWDSLHLLRQGIVAASLITKRDGWCTRCRAEHAECEAAKEAGRRLDKILRSRKVDPASPPTMWNRDRDGSEIFPRVQQIIHKQVDRLSALGFSQGLKKPWLFYLKIPELRGQVFVGFDGEEFEPIWKDPKPRVWYHDWRNRRLWVDACSIVAYDYLIDMGFALRDCRWVNLALLDQSTTPE